MNRIIFALLLTVLAFLFCNAAMLPAAAQTVHALLIIMDEDHLAQEGEDGIGPGCAVDRHYIENLLLSNVEDICKVETKTLLSSDGTATPRQVARWLDSVNSASDDVVFIYYSGHGGMGDWANQRTFLATLEEDLWRDDLVEWIDTKTGGARLKMLLTDCCSNTNEPPPKSQQIEKAAVTADVQMFKNLFLEHHGLLHITGATEGEFSWGSNPEYLDRPWTFLDGGYGGAFTRGIINALESGPDLNEDGFVSWEEVFIKTRENTMASFKASRFSDKALRDMERLGITNQTPKAYSLPGNSYSPHSANRSLSTPFLVTGNVTGDGTDDEFGKDEHVHRDIPITDVYFDILDIDNAETQFEIPDVPWGGECRVEVQLTTQVIGTSEIEITANAKLFEGTSEWTNDLEDEDTITFKVGVNDGKVSQVIRLRNTETGGGDHAKITFSFSVGPPGMVLIPAGEFQMGSNNGYDDEKPVHTVYMDAFYMDVYEVTMGQYKAFVQATGHRALPAWADKYSPTDLHPVVGVSQYDAWAYAKWAGKRLPSEAEWEKAARGGLVGAGYPWGSSLSNIATQANFADRNLENWPDSWNVKEKRRWDLQGMELHDDDDGYTYCAPVDSYLPNGYGLYNMAGNVWEWCLDGYEADFYARSPHRDPYRTPIVSVEGESDSRVLRGGSWGSSASVLRVADRGRASPTDASGYVGFRCARDVTP